jgi:hypothetical protein
MIILSVTLNLILITGIIDVIKKIVTGSGLREFKQRFADSLWMTVKRLNIRIP